MEILASLRAALAAHAPSPTPLCVAFSGGLDSTVLLHGLLAVCRDTAHPLRAVHVNHGLHPDAVQWAGHCEAVGRAWRVPVRVLTVRVDQRSGGGPEAAARDARYRALFADLGGDELLLTAHQRDDQVETVLLRLMRGAGPAGLAGMRAWSRRQGHVILRPLLDLSRAELAAYARARQLRWVEDPANRQAAYDRNFLRHQVLPLLRQRWPGAPAAVARSAGLAAEADELLGELARADAGAALTADALPVPLLRGLSVARRHNLLRQFLRQHGVRPPGAARLAAGLAQLLDARADAEPSLAWDAVALRRYRDRVYLVRERGPGLPAATAWNASRPLALGPGLGSLRLAQRRAPGGLDPGLAGQAFSVHWRRGGERLRPQGHAHHRSLKHLFQEAGIVPWMRGRVPLLYAGGELVAVGDLWASAEHAAAPGVAGVELVWEARPALH